MLVLVPGIEPHGEVAPASICESCWVTPPTQQPSHMPTRTVLRARSQVRQARSSPFADITDSATRRKLRSLRPRSDCSRAVSVAALNRSLGLEPRAAAAVHPACPPFVTRLLGIDRAFNNRNPKSMLGVAATAKSRGIPGWPSRSANASGDIGRRKPIAMIPASALRRITGNGSRHTRRGLAPSGALAAVLVVALTADPDRLVRAAATNNPRVVELLLAALSTDQAWGVRRAVAEHPECPPGSLAVLGADTHPSVRWAVASHLSTPADVLTVLVDDDYEHAAQAVLSNPSCPPEALVQRARRSGLEPGDAGVVAGTSRR